MKYVPVGLAGLAIIVSGLLGFSNASLAQSGDEGPQPIISRALSATVDYGNDAIFSPAKHDTDFEQLGIDPGQTVNITVWFPMELAGQIVIGEPMDGGLLTEPEGGLIISAEGAITFQFVAGNFSGSCRLSVHQPDDQNLVNFWVMDLEHPENNPSGLLGGY